MTGHSALPKPSSRARASRRRPAPRSHIWPIGGLLIALVAIGARETLAQSSATLDTLVPALMREHHVPGLALAIVRGDSIVAVRGFGVARTRDGGPVDAERTLFRVASVAKLFVATAAMQQVERGRIDLHADVNGYLDGWTVPATFPEPVTVHHLLTHTAGFDERIIGYAARTREEIGPLGAHLRRNLPRRGWPPGQLTGYSNYGMALAAHVVERVTGTAFDRYAQREIFEPLGMARTHYLRVPDSLAADVADGHRCRDGECNPLPNVWSHPYPVGLAYSTAADMARFLLALVSERDSTRWLGADARRTLLAQQFTHDSSLPGMSYAFFNQRWRGRRVLAHGGNVPGVYNLLLVVPGQRVGLYFVTNGGASAIGVALRDSLLSRLLPALGADSARTEPTIALRPEDLRALAGPYQLTRYAHHTVERFPMVFPNAMSVTVNGDGLGLLLEGRMRRFAPVAPLRFREQDGERTLVFARDERGAVSHLYTSAPVFGAELPAALERRAWHDGAWFMNEYVSWLVAGPLLLLGVAWPLVALAWWWIGRRRNPRELGPRSQRRVAWAAAFGFTVLWIVFGFGFIARSVRMMEAANGIVFGPTTEFRVLALVPYLLLLVGLLVLTLCWRAWRDGLWDPIRRVLYGAMAVAVVLVMVFLVRWNYLPVVF